MFGNGDCTVLVEPETVRSLREAAEQAIPNETGGLLYGSIQSDDDGRYVLVSGFVQVSRDIPRPDGFNFAAGDTRQLRDDADDRFPRSLEEVGWWHSHAQQSLYTPADLEIQGRFEWPDSVGLLVFAAGLQWATAYLGPDAVNLGQSVELTEDDQPALPAEEGDGTGGTGAASRLTGPLPQLPARAGRAPGTPGGRPPWLPRVRTVAIGVTVILLAVVVMGIVDLAGRVHPYTPTAKSSSTAPTVTASTPAPVPTTPAPAPTTQQPPRPATTAPASNPRPTDAASLGDSYCEESDDEFTPRGSFTCYASVPQDWSSQVLWITGGGRVLGSGVQAVPIKVNHSETIYVIIGTPNHELARVPVNLSF